MIKKLVNHWWGVSIAVISSWWVACGSSTDSPVALHVRLANVQQAVQNSGGLSTAVQSLKVEFLKNDAALIDNRCAPITANDPQRTKISFDLTPVENITIIVSGYENNNCSGTPDWLGKVFGVTVEEGQEVVVPIYVTRRGQRVNPIRGTLPVPRAFSSATRVADGRVLVAGGFVGATKQDNVIKLQAACDAVLYDPGTATFSTSIPLTAGCRGLHRALPLNDGRVLLVGGSETATLDASGVNRPMLSADAGTLVSSAEVFNPATNNFESVDGIFPALQRSDAAAVLVGDQAVLLGGRTNLIRSDEIVRWVSNSNWVVDSVSLIAARSGAQALSLAQGILVAGGNAEDAHTLELLQSDTFEQRALPSEADDLKAVIGHTLTQIGTNAALMVGGVFNDISSGLSAAGFGITWTNDTPVVFHIQLNHARAYHIAETLPDGLIVLAGGIDGQLTATRDLEILDTTNLTNTPMVLSESISPGPIGMAAARLLDDSILLVGGLDLTTDGGVTLSGNAQLFAP